MLQLTVLDAAIVCIIFIYPFIIRVFFTTVLDGGVLYYQFSSSAIFHLLRIFFTILFFFSAFTIFFIFHSWTKGPDTTILEKSQLNKHVICRNMILRSQEEEGERRWFLNSKIKGFLLTFKNSFTEHYIRQYIGLQPSWLLTQPSYPFIYNYLITNLLNYQTTPKSRLHSNIPP